MKHVVTLFFTFFVATSVFASDYKGESIEPSAHFHVCSILDESSKTIESYAVLATPLQTGVASSVTIYYKNGTTKKMAIQGGGWGQWGYYTGGYRAELEQGGDISLSATGDGPLLISTTKTKFFPCGSFSTYNEARFKAWAESMRR
jgi:hypothetical protein